MPGNKHVFNDALKRASNAAWDRRWETAIREYKRALAEFPQDVLAHEGLAYALHQANRLEEALTEYQTLAKMQPQDPTPLTHVALLMEKMGRRLEAVETYLQIAELHRAQKQMGKAVETWRKASMLDPDRVETHEKLAAAFTEAGHYGAAAREWLTLAKLAQRVGDTAQAQHCVERALELEPENTQARFLLAELTGRSGSFGVQAGANPVELARRSALARLAASVLDQKTTWPRGEVEPAPSHADIATLMAQALDAQAKGRTREAIQLYEQAVAAGATANEILFNLAILYQNTLRYDAAIELLRKTVHDPRYALASHFALGQSLQAQGKVDEALAHYIQAMEIVDLASVNRAQADQVIRLYQSLAEGYRAKGDTESARRFSETLIKFLTSKGWEDKVREVRRHVEAAEASGTPLSLLEVFEAPESERVVSLLSESQQCLREGKLHAAGDLAFQAIELAPYYLLAHVQVAEIAAAAGRLQDAVDKYTMLAETAHARHDLPKAVAFYRRGLKLASQDVTLRAKLINALIESGQVPEAIAEYEQLGQILEQGGQLQKAADKYEEALALARRTGFVGAAIFNLRQRLGAVYVAQGQWDKALPIYQEIGRQRPEDPETRLRLVELYLHTGQGRAAETELDRWLARFGDSPEKRRETLTTLCQSFPNVAFLHRRLAQFYVSLGEVKQAVELLDGLGDRLLDAGEISEALLVIQDIISLNPPEAAEYRRLLEELKQKGYS